MIDLYNRIPNNEYNGVSFKEAGLKEVCKWWIQTYPKDIVRSQEMKLFVEIRERMEEILNMFKD